MCAEFDIASHRTIPTSTLVGRLFWFSWNQAFWIILRSMWTIFAIWLPRALRFNSRLLVRWLWLIFCFILYIHSWWNIFSKILTLSKEPKISKPIRWHWFQVLCLDLLYIGLSLCNLTPFVAHCMFHKNWKSHFGNFLKSLKK